MVELNKIESKYFDLLEGVTTISEFEKWVYESNWVENELTADEYTDLISLNYKTASSKYEIGKILNQKIDKGKFETLKIIKLLNSIIDRDGKEGESLIKMYDLYCGGYYFLKDLGLGIGLSVEAPRNYDVESFDELNQDQKKKVVDGVYPLAMQLAIELKDWIINGTLKLTGNKTSELNLWQYIDHRKPEDKELRVWKTIDAHNGKGGIQANKVSKDNWFTRIFKGKS